MNQEHRGPLLVLAIAVFAAICTEMLPVGLLPEIGQGLHLSTATTGLLVTCYAVLVAVMAVPLAAVAERWPRRSVLGALLAGYAVSNVLFAIAPNFAVAIVARAVGGLAHAGFFAVAVAAAVSLVDVSHSGRAIAVVMVGNALALVFGVPLGTVLGTALGWRWAFVLLAVAMAGLAGAVLSVLPSDPVDRAARRTSVLAAVRRPALLVMSGVIILLALGHFTLYTYVSELLQHDGIARANIGVVLFAYGCGGLLGLAAAGLVVNRWPERALVADVVLMGLSLAAAAVAGSGLGIVFIVVVWGVAFGALPTLTQTVTLRAAPDAADSASALVNGTTNAGIAGGALLGSRLIDPVGVAGLGWCGAGFALAALGFYALRPPRERIAGRRQRSTQSPQTTVRERKA